MKLLKDYKMACSVANQICRRKFLRAYQRGDVLKLQYRGKIIRVQRKIDKTGWRTRYSEGIKKCAQKAPGL